MKTNKIDKIYNLEELAKAPIILTNHKNRIMVCYDPIFNTLEITVLDGNYSLSLAVQLINPAEKRGEDFLNSFTNL